MSTHVIVVDRRTDFKGPLGSLHLITTKEYITRPEAVKGRVVRVINLSRDYSYLGFGYYCSLLAEARGQKVIPTVRTILDLSQKSSAPADAPADPAARGVVQPQGVFRPHR
jgi:hypothetical protein